MLSPASLESGVVGLAVEIQASPVVPGYPDEPYFCDKPLLSAVSPLDRGQRATTLILLALPLLTQSLYRPF